MVELEGVGVELAGWLAAMVRIYVHIHVRDRENCSSVMRGGVGMGTMMGAWRADRC